LDYYGNPLTYTIVTAPTNGTLIGSGNSYTYMPNNGFSGSDSFVFKVNNGVADSVDVSVPISVVNVPTSSAPYANNQTINITDVNQANPITLSAIDPGNRQLTYTILNSPEYGTISGTPPNITYTPSGGLVGTYPLTFEATDASTGNSNVATITINVSDDIALDLKVQATLERHGNFDYVTNSTVWDANISNQNLPASLYLSSEPAWFGNLAWPPFGPSTSANPTTPLTGLLPAEQCYQTENLANGGIFDANQCYYATSTAMYGDVNGALNSNGQAVVNIYDAELTAQKAIGLSVTGFIPANAEVDGSGTVNIYDAFLIAEYAVGLITKFPVQ
jgi:hypothetical protein